MSAYGSYSTLPKEPVIVGDWNNYLWIVVCGGLAGFFMAWGIGANDVANSFATSVGSKTLKLWQAVIIAGIFEFVGSIALGGETTKTIASDIANVSMFQTVPEIYMYGMLCALSVAGTWLLVATFWRLPVSTTHSIIGAVMGFALVYGGWNGVLWNQEKGDFPYSKGFLPVVLSWFFSPIIGGVLSAIIYNLNRFFILRRQNSTIKAIWSLPILLFFTLFINIMFVLAKGAKVEMSKTWPCVTAGPGMFGLYYESCNDLYAASAWIAACVGVGVAIIGGGIGIYFLRKKYQRDLDAEENASSNADSGAEEGNAKVKVDMEMEMEAEKVTTTSSEKKINLDMPSLAPDASFLQRMWFYVSFLPIAFCVQIKRGLFYDIFDGLNMDQATLDMHANAEKFNPHTENVYQALQVLSACCVSFAHGSNDVANAIGPFSAIYSTYQTFTLPGSKTTTPEWMFVTGGIGIVFGLMMYGYNIIRELGVNMLHLTPSRGFSAELAAGLTISLASFFGIPVSTTQIIVGCEVGVGLSEGTSGGLSWRVLLKTFLGWIWTILLSLAFCAALFSAGAYAPSIIMAQTINDYRSDLLAAQQIILKDMNTTNNLWKNNATWWTSTPAAPMRYNGSALLIQINKASAAIKTLQSPKKFVPQDQVMYYVAQTFGLYQNYSVTAIGQMNKTALPLGDVSFVPKP